MTVGCEAAKSGQFQIDFSTPLVADVSWRRLIDVAQHYDLSFEIVFLARSFSLSQWTEALQVGAFDVMNVVCDLPKAAEAAKRALEAAHLRDNFGRITSKCKLTGRAPKPPSIGGSNGF